MKGIKGEILSQVLEQAGIEVIINSNLSERLCKPCAAKLRRTRERMTFIFRTINVAVNPKFVAVNTRSELEVKKSVAVYRIYLSVFLYLIFQFVTENGKCQTPH